MFARLGLVLIAGLLAAPPALACSCLCEEPGAAQKRVDDAAYVFRGTVVSRQIEKDPDKRYELGDPIRMKVSRILKGAITDELTVYSPADPAMCGVAWRKGDTQDVLAYRGADGRLNVGSCGQICAAKSGVFELLEEKGQPVP